MNHILSALALVLAVATPASAVPQSGGQAEANRRLDFVRSVTGDRSWMCSLVPVGRNDPHLEVDMSLSLLPGGHAFATTTSKARLNGRTYSATYRLVGEAEMRTNGQVTLWLNQSRMVRADPLPRGQNWSDTSSVRISFAVIPDTISSGRHPYMLQGVQTDTFGRAAMNCIVQTRR